MRRAPFGGRAERSFNDVEKRTLVTRRRSADPAKRRRASRSYVSEHPAEEEESILKKVRPTHAPRNIGRIFDSTPACKTGYHLSPNRPRQAPKRQFPKTRNQHSDTPKNVAPKSRIGLDFGAAANPFGHR